MYNRARANVVLAGVFFLFVVMTALKYYYRDVWGITMLRFMAEAALVGGIADWFAVTALFSRPLGFPWHTEIIPRHRERVIGAVSDMIEKELLSASSIKKRLESIQLVESFIVWVEEQQGRVIMKETLQRFLPRFLKDIDITQIEPEVWRMIEDATGDVKIAPYIKKAAVWLLEGERYERLTRFLADYGLEFLRGGAAKQEIYRYLVATKEKKTKSVIEKFVFWLGEQTDSVNLAEAAGVLHDNLQTLITRLKDPQHEIHGWLQGKLQQLVQEDEWVEQAEEWKKEWLSGLRDTGVITAFLAGAIATIKTPEAPLYNWLYIQAQEYWENFKKDQEGQQWLEARVKEALYRLIDNEHHLIGAMVKTVLNSFSKEDLNRFIEERAGEDLQWIRINGSIVGAAVGLGLFLFLHFVYAPLLAQGW